MLGLLGNFGKVRAFGVALGLAGLVSACGSDSSDGGDGLGDDSPATDSGADGGGGPPEPEGSTSTTGVGTSSTTGQDPTGSGTDTGGTGGTNEGDDFCSLDCGEAECVLDDFGLPQCVCAASDEQWSGSQCIECVTVIGNAFDVDIDVVDAMFDVTLDDAAFPDSLTEGGQIVLRSRDTADEIVLGPTGPDGYMASVVMGTYDAYYEFVRGGSQVPLNRSAWLGEILVSDSDRIPLNVRRTLVDTRIFVNGELGVDSNSNIGRVFLVDPRTGDEVLLSTTAVPERALYVVPGKYDVHYRWVDGLSVVPQNTDAFVQTVVIEDTDDVQPLNIEIDFQEYTGSIYVDGELPPPSQTEYGDLVLKSDENPDDEFYLAATSDREYSVNLIEGSYSLYYRFRAGGTTVPLNSWGRIGSFTPNADVQLETVLATGDFTIGAQTPPDDGTNDGVVSLRTDEGDHVVLGNTAAGQYSRRVLRGMYWPHYSQESAGGQVPANTNARLATSVDIQPSSPTHSIDVGIAQVTGTITLNKEVPPTSEYDDGRVYLRNRQTGDSVLLGNTRMGGFAKPIVPGDYDVVYVVEAAGTDVPVNTEAIIVANQFIGDGDDISVNIPVGRLTGSVLVNGAPAVAAGADIILQDVETLDEVFLGTLDDPQYDEALAGGRYLARYRSGPTAYNGPVNTDAVFMCLDITAAN